MPQEEIVEAIGDSLGAAIEFWPLSRILDAYPSRFAHIPPYGGRHGFITDDTQMTLFAAEGLLEAYKASDGVAVTHFGDSDSTSAIASNMLGLMFSDQVFSHRWADQIEWRNLIETLASGLAEMSVESDIAAW